MTRKRFIKLAMSECMDRNEAVFSAEMALLRFGSYERAYMELFFIIRDRFEFYMPGYEKRIAKRNKKGGTYEIIRRSKKDLWTLFT